MYGLTFQKAIKSLKDYIFANKKRVLRPQTGKEESRRKRREIRDVLTNFVVNESDNKSTIKLIDLINTVMKMLFKKYYYSTGIRLFLLYRGGNIIRIYREAFENHITGPAREYFISYFDEYFKQSDLDFYVVIEDHTLSDEKLEAIAEDIQAMSYEALCYIRDSIVNQPTDYLAFTRYNKTYMNKLLSDTLNKIKDTIGGVKYTTLTYGKGRQDFVVHGEGIIDIPYPQSYRFIDSNPVVFNRASPFYISINPEIRNEREGMAFRLSRLMINFTADGNVNLPCELYDVSIGLPSDKMFEIYDKHSYRKFYYQGDGSINIPTLITLLKDLYVILFEYRPYPWMDGKYLKRIKRFMVLLMIHDMTLDTSLKEIHTTVTRLSTTRNLCKLLPSGNRKLSLSAIPTYVKLVESRLDSDPEHKEKFEEMIAEIQRTANELKNVLDKVREFIQTQGKFYLDLRT
jgi:hypothetical protein